MPEASAIFLGKGRTALEVLLSRANRHGLIAGATGTGKTVTLRVMAEGFSAAGVPVFVADVKGDLAGLSQAGSEIKPIAERIKKLGLKNFAYAGAPSVFWDLFGEQGHPIRATVSEMGPLLLSRLLELNDTQSGVLQLAFKVADDNGLLLIDLKDLRALLTHLSQNAAEIGAQYGNVATTTVGAIQRSLLTLEAQGGSHFFGEPQLELADLMRKDGLGRGIISILAADKLMMRPKLYATFLLWLLSELYEQLPEEGDIDKPKLVFFFDEAHLLFDDAPAALVEKVEQVVRLIRSKGVGVYFVSQSPLDLPDTVLGQLGNRVQHALRAFTPRDQKAVKAAAETFRPDPKLDTARAIQELAVGEALVSLLDEKGAPTIVQRALIAPPGSRLGTITVQERGAVMRGSPCAGKYDETVERESAYEQLGSAQTAKPAAAATTAPAPSSGGGIGDMLGGIFGSSGGATTSRAGARRPTQSMGEMVMKSVVRNVAGQVGRQIGTQIVRGILGSILKR